VKGYIAIEPDLRVDRVPAHLLDSPDILWPAHMNTLSEVVPGKPVSTFNANALYHRYNLIREGATVLVWTQRDANALPGHVLAEIIHRAAVEHDD
jgi:hypothetical protein